MVPPRVAQKMSVVSVESMAFLGSRARAKSGGTRPAARFSPSRGRGGDRGVARHRAQLAGPPRGAGGAGGGPGGPVGRMGGCRPGGWWVRLHRVGIFAAGAGWRPLFKRRGISARTRVARYRAGRGGFWR